MLSGGTEYTFVPPSVYFYPYSCLFTNVRGLKVHSKRSSLARMKKVVLHSLNAKYRLESEEITRGVRDAELLAWRKSSTVQNYRMLLTILAWYDVDTCPLRALTLNQIGAPLDVHADCCGFVCSFLLMDHVLGMALPNAML